MICSNCGTENPDHLVFCQGCGNRLRPRVAPPTPPVGLGLSADPVALAAPFPARGLSNAPQQASGQQASGPSPITHPPGAIPTVRCNVCGTDNPSQMRYCMSCGSGLAAVRPAEEPAPAPRAEPIAQAPMAQAPMAQAKACSRCRGANDDSSQFCKYCGNALGDGTPPPPAAMIAPSRDAMQPAMHPAPHPIAPAPALGAARGGPLLQPIPSPAPIAPVRVEGVPSSMGGLSAGALAPGGSTAAANRPAASVAPARSSAAPPRASQAAGAQVAAGRIVVVARDGQAGPAYPIRGQLDIGREEGDVVVSDDKFLSPRHARLAFREGKLFLKDLAGGNGVYVRLQATLGKRLGKAAAAQPSGEAPAPGEAAIRLEDQDLILMGQQVLRFEVVKEAEGAQAPAWERGTMLFGTPPAPRYGRLVQRGVEGAGLDVYTVRKPEMVLGRESGDIVFAEDPFMSRRHAALRVEPQESGAPHRFVLADLGSSNGTFIRLRGEIEVLDRDQFRVGQQLFRIELGPTA